MNSILCGRLKELNVRREAMRNVGEEEIDLEAKGNTSWSTQWASEDSHQPWDIFEDINFLKIDRKLRQRNPIFNNYHDLNWPPG